MKPHIDNHNPDPTYIRALLEKAGLSQRKTAHILGVSERMMRYYLVRTDDPNYRPMPYTVQFAIECLVNDEKSTQ
ncbi:DNA-binding transcriptional regulator [Moraxella sp. ZY210820]|uniref:helix-turn-helix domain-containing protein n=1 Tax=Moraxella sp. ZY210820 TaxID=2904123 RepID=UPI0027322BA7|nr:helix-turn-helix transcriptional regulator [Moraxella sp. ZY210820]WLF84819.1 helix-turn-helix transcriptional regulator [Moraxella sp. ZY210820]